jgi:CRP-like cAMP-binding protein
MGMNERGMDGVRMGQPINNGVLAHLPAEEWHRMSSYLERVALPKGKMLYDYGDAPRYGYFLVSGMASVLGVTEDGDAIQIATVTRDGFAGLPIVLHTPATSQAVMHLPGEGYRVRADALQREFRRCGAFHLAMLEQLDRLITESACAVVCHRYHSTRQRFCRWLLTARGGAGVDTIDVTQEQVAEMLAVPRTAISSTAASLQDRGLIRQRHGRIQILKPLGLETLTCECYWMLRRAGRGDLSPIVAPERDRRHSDVAQSSRHVTTDTADTTQPAHRR